MLRELSSEELHLVAGGDDHDEDNDGDPTEDVSFDGWSAFEDWFRENVELESGGRFSVDIAEGEDWRLEGYLDLDLEIWDVDVEGAGIRFSVEF